MALLKYKHISVHFWDGQVDIIESDSPQWVTPSGIRVGSTREQVIAAYGPASARLGGPPPESLPMMQYRIGDGCDCYFDLHLRDGRVASVRVWFDNT